MASVPLQLYLGAQTGFITREDGLKVISTLNPLESTSRHTLGGGKNFTSDWIHGRRVMSSHLETEIAQSSGGVLQQRRDPVNVFPEASETEATTEAAAAHSQYYELGFARILGAEVQGFRFVLKGFSEVSRNLAPSFRLGVYHSSC